jgi:serine/threonine protein kinase
MSITHNSMEPATETVMPVQQEMVNHEKVSAGAPDVIHAALESVVTAMSATVLEEPEITPIRTRSPPVTPGSHSPQTNGAKRGRIAPGSVSDALTKSAKRRKRKQQSKKAPTGMSTTTGLTPSESGGEDSDYFKRSPKVLSPKPHLPALAGASPYLRPGSPGLSNLKAQLDAFNLSSAAGSRSASRSRVFCDSDVPSSGASATSDHNTEDSAEELVSYDIPIDQDFVSESLVDSKASTSVSTVCADQLATSMIMRKMTAEDFTPVKCLGDGSFGIVHLVRQNATGRLFAQKQLTKAKLTVTKKSIEMTKSERSILELVNRQPFIVNLYYAFQDREKLYLILEYAQGGELFHHLNIETMFTEDKAAFYLAEIVLALDYLHNTVGVIYRDLKPENCLLDADGHLLLTDFGLSKVAVEDPATPGGSRCNSLGVGTFEYMAPELIRGSDISDWGPGYGKACDWWSFGALACDMMTGSPPFKANNITKLQQEIMKAKLKLPYVLSPDAKDLLNRLLRKEPSKRLGVKKDDIAVIKKHRFFRKIDWKKLENRELEPPIRPLITNPELAENFDTSFTNRPVSEVNHRRKRTLSTSDPFGGFSFVAPSSLLEQGLLGRLNEAIDDEEDEPLAEAEAEVEVDEPVVEAQMDVLSHPMLSAPHLAV